MVVNSFKSIIFINEVGFFLGWMLVYFLGNLDNNHPISLGWLLLLITFLEIVQYFYLKKFLPKLYNKTKGLFFKNLLYFSLAGFAVNMLLLLADLKSCLCIGFKNALILSLIILAVGIFHGLYFYFINAILIKLMKK